MTDLTALGLLCGLALGVGLWLLVSLAPRISRPRLSTRVAPYVTAESEEARRLVDRQTADPLPVFATVFSPVLTRAATVIGSLISGTAQLERRLHQAGSDDSVTEFRIRQLVWAIVGGIAATVGAVVAVTIAPVPPMGAVALVAFVSVAAFLARGQLLRLRAERRMKRMTRELPTTLEFVTLSLSAGEGILDAVRRVATISRGELAAELAAVVRDVATGATLADALSALATRLQLPPLSRAIDQIIGALERGTPLAEVLRAQAQDARDEEKRELLTIAGRKEIAMLFPLVFLILPLTILIAVWPGLAVLQLGTG